MRKFLKYLTLAVILGIFVVTGMGVFRSADIPQSASLPPERTYEKVAEPLAEKQVSPAVDAVLPVEVNLKVPFTSQAPHQNWELPYGEFCEEASVLMAASYIHNQPLLGPADADAKLLAIRDFEEKTLGFQEDTNAEDTATILRKYYGLERVEVVPDPSVDDIKRALSLGKAVIAPFAGRQLGNPYYQHPGPIYHMLVIKGYNKSGDFITNDPGTRHGADFVYKADRLMEAIHDWNDGEVETGKKVIIIVG